MERTGTYHNPSSAFSRSRDIDEADQEIKFLEKSHLRSLRVLKVRRNAMTPIFRLPPEMLVRIFKLIAAMDLPKVRWIKVSHVCLHWRAVALECSSLWSIIPLLYPRWVEVMLRRSKVTPLVVKNHFAADGPAQMACLQSALKHVARIRELNISSPKSILDKLLSDMSSPAPLLESLNLHSSRRASTFPKDFLKGETPHLRLLELHNCNLAWDSPLLSGLTQLKIHSHSSAVPPSTNQLLDALEKMPNLETLVLVNTLPFFPSDTATSPSLNRVINLARLSYIHISSRVLPCAHFLGHLSYPATATIKFVCGATDDDDFSSLLPAISRSTGTGFDSDLRGVSARYFPETNRVSLYAWNSTSKGIYLPDITQARVQIEYTLCQRESAHTAVRALCMALYLKELQTVHVLDFVDFPEDIWLIFGRLPKLRYLLVQGYCGPGLLHALSPESAVATQQSKSPQNGDSVVYFPGLRHLAIDQWDYMKFGTTESGERLVDCLRTCLMERWEHGAEIWELHISECYCLFRNEVQLLEEIVVDVDWDEMEDYIETEDYDDDDDDDDDDCDGCPVCGYDG